MPEKRVGEEQRWHDARPPWKTLKRMQVPYEVDAGGGAFYGPKIDLKVKDAGPRMAAFYHQFDFNA